MHLSLSDAAADPGLLTQAISLPNGSRAALRPLVVGDEKALGCFYRLLGSRTRQFYDVGADSAASLAAERCGAIARYDKFRLVLQSSGGEIVGLFELSLDLVPLDVERFAAYGLPLRPGSDVRYGLCLADSHQGRGHASAAQPFVNEAARAFGAQRVILLGGVHETNVRAIRFYEHSGFVAAGHFTNRDGVRCMDMILTL